MIRILGSEGQILKFLIRKGKSTAPQLSMSTRLGKGTTYYTLKELIATNYVKEYDGIYEVTREGIEAFWSTILSNDLASKLVKVSEEVGIGTYDLVELGVRLLLDIIEYGMFSDEVKRFIDEYDPALARRLASLTREEVVT